MNLEDLLKEWSEVEPERCQFEKDHGEYGMYYLNGIAIQGLTLKDGNQIVRLFCIQGAVQQSIEARKLSFSQESIYFEATDSYLHRAIVDRIQRESYASPVIALLAAYLKTIKQTAEVTK